MRLEFDVTLSEAVDVAMHALDRSRAARPWLRVNFFGSMFIWVMLAGLSIVGYMYMADGIQSREFLISLGVVTALSTAALYPSIYRNHLRSRIRQDIRQQVGSVRFFSVQVELTPLGIMFQQLNMQLTFEWPEVEGVEETSKVLYLLLNRGRLIAVSKTAFASVAESDQFLEEIEYFQRHAHPVETDSARPTEESFYDPQATRRGAPHDEGV